MIEAKLNLIGAVLVLAVTCIQPENVTTEDEQEAEQLASTEESRTVKGKVVAPHCTSLGKLILKYPPIGIISVLVIEN